MVEPLHCLGSPCVRRSPVGLILASLAKSPDPVSASLRAGLCRVSSDKSQTQGLQSLKGGWASGGSNPQHSNSQLRLQLRHLSTQSMVFCVQGGDLFAQGLQLCGGCISAVRFARGLGVWRRFAMDIAHALGRLLQFVFAAQGCALLLFGGQAGHCSGCVE